MKFISEAKDYFTMFLDDRELAQTNSSSSRSAARCLWINPLDKQSALKSAL